MTFTITTRRKNESAPTDFVTKLPVHEFHTTCVDAWLTTHKKFCPICKHDICRKAPESSTEVW
ncbi:hypothetical protein BDC45DRAFT_565270 [Circinella umbellata]|nr:hypothetical protein BDC45DRAFT_565270 [Circinella umbellata]